MFQDKFSYHVTASLRTSTSGINGEKRAYFHKAKTTSNKPYIIRVDEYENNVFFIKFYPKGLEQNSNKYKFRNDPKVLKESFTRLVSTCIKVAQLYKNKSPDAIFGFHGQWDDVDVKLKRELSQRYSIYSRVVASKVSSQDYKHIAIEQINTFLIIPSNIYTEGLQEELFKQFMEIFGDNIDELRVPS